MAHAVGTPRTLLENGGVLQYYCVANKFSEMKKKKKWVEYAYI